MKTAEIGIFMRTVASLLIVGFLVVYYPVPAFSQQGETSIQDLIVNGGFEGGFQEEFGVGYGWGGFSNGNAVVGWNYDDWPAVVPGDQYAQRLEIKEALDQDRYAGIYQTISVVPGQQYKLTVKGLIRSEEGSVEASDYGYRLQYAIDYNGDTAWELVDPAAWQEFPWDEQPLTLTGGEAYQIDTFDTTITAQTDEITVFIRGWKKWINNGSGIFDIDEISVVGPAPAGYQSPLGQVAVVAEEVVQQPAEKVAVEEIFVVEDTPAEAAEEEITTVVEEPQAVSEEAPAPVVEESEAPADDSAAMTLPSQNNAAPQGDVAPLPATGQGNDGQVLYVVVIGLAVLLALFGSAITATIKRRGLAK